MKDAVPFFAGEVEVSLYPAAADGSALQDQAVWSGCRTRALSLPRRFETVKIARTGAANKRTYQLNEEIGVEIGKVWAVKKSTMREFRPERNQRFVLQLIWNDKQTRVNFQRVYFGVTLDSQNLTSEGVLKINEAQVFGAESMESGPCC